jgi:hypothetical protein
MSYPSFSWNVYTLKLDDAPSAYTLVKTIPLQDLTDLEGSRRLRLPHFKTMGT